MSRVRFFAGGALLALLVGAVSLYGQFSTAADLEVRTVPWRTQAGRMQRSTPLGQGFRCSFDGLQRIEVALVPLAKTEGARLDLVLREDLPTGTVLRRVTATDLPDGPGWGRFDFLPIADSAGRDFWWHLEIVGDRQQSPYSPWVRYHGQVGINTGWGHRIAQGQVFEGRLYNPSSKENARGSYARVPHPHLSAVSFAAETLRPAVGPAILELWGPGQVPFKSKPLRQIELANEQSTHGGYAFFAFEPISDSRWVDIHFRLTVAASARLVAGKEGLSFITWHGKGLPAKDLLGQSSGPLILKDRSLIFRAFSSPSTADLLTRMGDRGSWRMGAGALLWVLATALLAHALGKAWVST